MERLTITDAEMEEIRMYNPDFDCPIKADDSQILNFCDYVCDEFQHNCPFKNTGNRLKAYEDAEEQGVLLRLPVAIGSTIYHFEYPTKIDDNGTEWSILDKKRATIKPMKFALCHLNGIGKLYFLTKEEAEQALAERKNDE